MATLFNFKAAIAYSYFSIILITFYPSLEVNIFLSYNFLIIHFSDVTLLFEQWIILKGEFAVGTTAKICGRSLSAKILVGINSIFMKLYVT